MRRFSVSRAALALTVLLALPVQAAEGTVHQGQGTVNRVEAAAGKVNLTHGPIPSLKWPAMTMNFPVKDKKVLTGLKPGQKIDFKLSEQAKGQYVITEVAPAK